MYRRPKFLEVLHGIREEMSREADYDMDSFAELIKTGEKKNGSNGTREARLEDEDRKPKSAERKFTYGNRF